MLLKLNKSALGFAIALALVTMVVLSAAALGKILVTNNKAYESDSKFHALAGDEFALAGLNLMAIEAYERSLLLKEDLAVRSNLAVLYHQEGSYVKAIQHLRVLLTLEPLNPSFNYDLAVNLVDKFRNTDDKDVQDLVEALAFYEAASLISPGFSNAENNIAALKKVLSEANIQY